MNGSASGARTRPGSAAPRLASKTIETGSLRGNVAGLGLNQYNDRWVWPPPHRTTAA